MINPQIISIFGSIVSLVFAFDMYYEAQKRGALGMGGNIYGRVIRLASTLLLVVSRLLSLVLCAYCFGEGMFYPLVLLVIVHVWVMSLIHYVTSYEWELVEASQTNPDTAVGTRKLIETEMKLNMTTKNGTSKTCWTTFSIYMIIAYQCLINGIGNVYLHNWIVNYHSLQGPSQQMKTTFLRQVIVDLIIAIENIIVVVMVLNSTHSYLQDLPRSILIIILVCHFFGIILKIIYYHVWHMWAYAFDIVRVDCSNSYPKVSLSIPYFCCGEKGVWKIGSQIRTNVTEFINRPTVDVIFNRQSIGKTPGIAMLNTQNTSDYIHMNTLGTSSGRKLINAIVEASNNSLSETPAVQSSCLEPTIPHKPDLSELRSLFNDFMDELESDKKGRPKRKSNSFKFSERDVVRFDDECFK